MRFGSDDARAAGSKTDRFTSSKGEIDSFLGIEDDSREAVARDLAELQALRTGREPEGDALGLLGLLFGVDAWRAEVVLICLGPRIDARFGSVYAYLQDDYSLNRVTPLLLQQIIDANPHARLELHRFLHQHPLVWKWRLLELERVSGNIFVDADPRLLLFVEGRVELAAEAVPLMRFLPERAEPPEGLDARTVTAIESLIRHLSEDDARAGAYTVDLFGPIAAVGPGSPPIVAHPWGSAPSSPISVVSRPPTSSRSSPSLSARRFCAAPHSCSPGWKM